jgi:hypothetical protein
LLTIVPLVPQAIGLFHLLIVGGLNWPMLWTNEAAAWTALLSFFAVLAFYIGIRSKLYILSLLPAVSFVFCWVIFFLVGVEPSSKSDATELELLAFWFTQSRYW